MSTTFTIWDVPSQPQAVETLRGAVQRGDVGHAWALVGPAGVGQEQLARSFAAAANHANNATEQRFLRGVHPAYREFAPVGAEHRKDDVHSLWLDAANQTLKDGGVKVLRIVQADRMNPPAANAFLKTLEEPPVGTVWVLDLSDPEQVPDTILSRCRVVHVNAWTREQMLEEASQAGVALSDVPLVVAVSMGSPTRLRELSDPHVLAAYRFQRSWLHRMMVEGPGFTLRATAALKAEIARREKTMKAAGDSELETLTELYGDEVPKVVVKQTEERYKRLARAEQTRAVQQALDDVVGWCRDVLVVSNGGKNVRNVDVVDELAQVAPSVSAAAVFDICDHAAVTRDAIEVNVNWALAVETFLLGAHTRLLQQ